MFSWRCGAMVVIAGFVAGSLHGDTLILKDGSRLQGTLLSVRDGVIEFEARRTRGFGGRERVRIDRIDVVRIDLDEEPGRGDVDDRGVGTGWPSGMRERDVHVDARTGWVDTGLTVRQGQTVYFRARGRVRWGPGRQDGPDGERNSPRNDARPIPSRPAAALIGRVGDGDEYFFIGDNDQPIRMRAGGRLSLGVNDDYLADNSGAFDVTIAH